MVIKTPEELPIYGHRQPILDHIASHRVTHIQGETGCGKSTQVPKYIMEDAEERRRSGNGDGRTKIVVTQPRRMAAITLARRVASELGEEVGKTIGYKISGDSVSGKMCFATTGFLLQVLVNQPEEFGTYTHVILDEVHERSVDADLLTMLMKLLMQCYTDVKLIVMSATLQAKLFADYFQALELEYLGHKRGRSAPKLKVEPIFVGVRTFDVEEIFLDEIEDQFNITSGQARQGMEKALRGFSSMGKGKGKGKGKDKGKSKGGGDTASGFKRLEPQITEGFDYLCRDLVQQMARETCTLIVFLPGIADITSFYEVMQSLDTARAPGGGGADSGNWRDDVSNWRDDYDTSTGASSGTGVKLRIYPMHSLIPREEQEEVFSQPPKGVCHVVLSSNIAESSLTLPSVCGIIDLAMRRSIQYDARRLMSCLVTTWCSQSSCKQRAGRAGRTMPGRAVRMVTRSFFEQEMPGFDPPEMLNAPLTKLYLQAKQLCYKLDNLFQKGIIPEGIAMDLKTPKLLLGEVVQPPSTTLVAAAIKELADVGCIDRPSEEALITPLGYVAMALPCELRLCRLLYLGLCLGCPCDAIAMVAGLTSADPFSTPSLLVLKDEAEYTKKLERSFTARRWCDRGRHSEPLMLRDLFREWINAGAPRGSRSIGGFARTWSIIPKKFEALATESVDLCTRLCKLLHPRSSGHQAIQKLMATMRFTVDRREELMKVEFPSNASYSKLFSEDVGLMRALLCCAFSDQMLFALKPKWAGTGGGGKKKTEEKLLDIMKKQDLSYNSTICYLNPPQELRAWGKEDAEENHLKLCEAMCGERAARVHFDEREKLLFFDFKEKPAKGKNGKRTQPEEEEQESEFDPCPVIADVCQQAHRLHQFGAGRWKFSVESPVRLETEGGWGEGYHEERSTSLELFRPLQPFHITWEVVQHTSREEGGGKGKGKKGGAKKAAPVKAMPDWRNPLGYACNARADLPAEELIGVCASVQGLESGGSAFVAGATALGLNYVPLLLCTLDPIKWDVQWGFDEEENVRSVKIMQNELVLPPDTITWDVMSKINQFRWKLRESLTPWSKDDSAPDLRNPRNGRGRDDRNSAGNAYIWVGDLSAEMIELIEEIWPTPDPVQKSKKALYYCSAATADWEWEEDEDEEYDAEVIAPLQPLAEELDWDSAMNYTTAQSSSNSKKGKKDKQGDGLTHRQGVAQKDMDAVRGVQKYLNKKWDHQEKLSSLCARFPTNKKTLNKFSDVFDLWEEKGNQMVALKSGGGGGGSKNKKGGAKGANGKGSGKGKGGKAPPGTKAGDKMDSRIAELCRVPEIAVKREDFDSRVRTWFVRFQQRRGTSDLEEAFDVLADWCTKKTRESVRSWPSYLMVLLRNWERATYETEADSD